MAIESKNHRQSPVRGTTHGQGSRDNARLPIEEIAERGERDLAKLEERRSELVEEKHTLSLRLKEIKRNHKDRNREISLSRFPKDLAVQKTITEKERFEKERRPLSDRVFQVESELAEIKPRLKKYNLLQEGRTQEQKQDAFQSISQRLKFLEFKVDEILKILNREKVTSDN